MPTYEYFCKKCGAEFEKFQRMSDEPLKICPNCGEAALERKISGGAGLIFKGSGFYITDYRNKRDSHGAMAKTHSKSPAQSAKKTVEKSVSELSESSSKNSISK